MENNLEPKRIRIRWDSLVWELEPEPSPQSKKRVTEVWSLKSSFKLKDAKYMLEFKKKKKKLIKCSSDTFILNKLKQLPSQRISRRTLMYSTTEEMKVKCCRDPFQTGTPAAGVFVHLS